MARSVCLKQCQWQRDVRIYHDVSLYQRIEIHRMTAIEIKECDFLFNLSKMLTYTDLSES